MKGKKGKNHNHFDIKFIWAFVYITSTYTPPDPPANAQSFETKQNLFNFLKIYRGPEKNAAGINVKFYRQQIHPKLKIKDEIGKKNNEEGKQTITEFSL